MSDESFTCPVCSRTSHNPNDVIHQYCGHCHTFPEQRMDIPPELAKRFADSREELDREVARLKAEFCKQHRGALLKIIRWERALVIFAAAMIVAGAFGMSYGFLWKWNAALMMLLYGWIFTKNSRALTESYRLLKEMDT